MANNLCFRGIRNVYQLKKLSKMFYVVFLKKCLKCVPMRFLTTLTIIHFIYIIILCTYLILEKYVHRACIENNQSVFIIILNFMMWKSKVCSFFACLFKTCDDRKNKL